MRYIKDLSRGFTGRLSSFSGLFVVILVMAITLVIGAALPSRASDEVETTFTFAVVPDTQQEVLSSTNPLLPNRYQWLVNNKQALNLKFIAHTGDVVNWGVVEPVQFQRASTATNTLDNSGIPFSYAIGNHDGAAVTTGGGAAAGNVRENLRKTQVFNQYFPLSRFKNVEGTFEPNKVDNMYQTFTAGGYKWLVLTHEMWPRSAVITWAKQVVADHPDYNVIVSTHAFVNGAGQLPTTGVYGDTNAQVEWDTFISQYPNIKFVVNGHYGAKPEFPAYGYFERTGVNGNKVSLIDTAYHSNFQDHVRLLSIDVANNTMSSKVYVPTSINSAYPSGYIIDGASNFVATSMAWIAPADSGPVTPTDPTAPAAPVNVSAVAGNGTSDVSFTAPASDGGSAITSYTVTSNPGGFTATGTASPITVTGLANGTSYTFSVTATNSIGTSQPSTSSASVTPSTVADAPTALNAIAGNGQVGLSWGAPASNGGSVVSDYIVQYKATSASTWTTFSDGTSNATNATVTSLTNGTSYDFQVIAVNARGASAASAMATAQPVGPAPSAELLPDPGFEQGNGGWSAFNVGTFTRVSSPVQSGQWALRVTSPKTTSDLVGLSHNKLITSSVEGKTYTFQCYVRGTSAGLNVYIRFLQYTQNMSSNVKIGTTVTGNLSTSAWTLVKVSGTATKSGERIIPQIYSSNQTSLTGGLLYDSCSVKSN